MGNHKFRFSNMIPNAWFHKLSPRPDHHETLNRTTKHSSELSEQRKSYYFTRDLLTIKPDNNNNNSTVKTTEIPVHERRRRSTNKNHRQRLGSIDDHGSLPPIITKKNEGEDLLRRFPGVKLRTNSPRIVNWRRRRSASISECSLAVVKASLDPRRDFRESMVEMIVENNIQASKDLEQLLACYLSLNSEEYHRLIINVFKEIWFEFRPLIN